MPQKKWAEYGTETWLFHVEEHRTPNDPDNMIATTLTICPEDQLSEFSLALGDKDREKLIEALTKGVPEIRLGSGKSMLIK